MAKKKIAIRIVGHILNGVHVRVIQFDDGTIVVSVRKIR